MKLIINVFIPDKQQELDLPSLRIEDAVAATGSVETRAAKKKDRVQRGPAAMSHISGVKRPLTHTNSFTGERVPAYGVETPHEEQLGKVCSLINLYYRKYEQYCNKLLHVCTACKLEIA